MPRSTTKSTLLAAIISSAAAQKQVANYTTGTLGNASVITDNPAGAAFIATLPPTAFSKAAYPHGGNVKGSVQVISMPSGQGVMIHVTFTNLPAQGGPFLYHIHDQPVPKDGNCTATLGHLDPYQRGDKPPCDPALPETCQVGDLSTKHGKIDLPAHSSTATFTATYTDVFASTRAGAAAFVGNRSIVLHAANATRLTCANFVPVHPDCHGTGRAPPKTPSSYNGSAPATPAPAPTPPGPATGAATAPPGFVATAAGHANAARALAAVGGAAALVLVLL